MNAVPNGSEGTATYTQLSWSQRIIAGRLARVYQDEPTEALRPPSDTIKEICDSILLPLDVLPPQWGDAQIQAHLRLIGVLNPSVFTKEFRLEIAVYVVKVGDQLLSFWETLGGERPVVRDIYQVFGHHDIVLTVLGTQSELESLEGFLLRAGYEFVRLRVKEIVKYRGYDVSPISQQPLSPTMEQAANTVAADYQRAISEPALKSLLSRLTSRNFILGPTVLEDVQWSGRARAWVAIRFGGSVLPRDRAAFQKLLLEAPEVYPNLTSLFRLDPDDSSNFYYLAELACDTFGELDIATDTIISSKLRLETLTLPITKALERPWMLRATGPNVLSGGFGRVWFKLNSEQKDKLASKDVPAGIFSMLDDTLKNVYREQYLGAGRAPQGVEDEVDSYASRFVRAVIDEDLHGIRSVHSDMLIFVERSLRHVIELIAKAYFKGSRQEMANAVGVVESERPGWKDSQTLLDRWLSSRETRASTGALDRWAEVSAALSDLLTSRNRRFHGLAATQRAAFDRLVFQVAKDLEDSAESVRWLYDLAEGARTRPRAPIPKKGFS